MESTCSARECTLVSSPQQERTGLELLPFLQISAYESIAHSDLLTKPTAYFANSYIIRKALIRKHYLAHTIGSYVAKNPKSLLKTHVPTTLALELDYAEFLDEALLEAYELHEAWARNECTSADGVEWWILKPSMSDKGQGIRIFSSESELRAVFEEWEAGVEHDEGESDSDGVYVNERKGGAARYSGDNLAGSDAAATMTSQLRYFVVQPYVKPLLFPEFGHRKFHIRSYVLCIGALHVYVYKEMLGLFAQRPYKPPRSEAVMDMCSHLTNTGLQTGDVSDSVHRFRSLPERRIAPRDSDDDWKLRAFEQIKSLTAELFNAAAAQPISFQPLPNAFEIFGIDWLVDFKGDVWLLEVNAFPDFSQTGTDLQEVVQGLWTVTVGMVVRSFFGVEAPRSTSDMIEVLNLDLGRR